MNKDIPQSIEKYHTQKQQQRDPKNRYQNVREMYQDLLTALNDDRMNEEPYVYPYKEHEVDDATKVMKPIDEGEPIATPIVDETEKKTNKWIKILAGVLAGIALILYNCFLYHTSCHY